MDANKLQKLKDLDYSVRRACGNCKYYNLAAGSSRFSTCQLHTYDHLKHTDTTRQLSVNLYGHCSSHEWNNRSVGQMGAFADLKEK